MEGGSPFTYCSAPRKRLSHGGHTAPSGMAPYGSATKGCVCPEQSKPSFSCILRKIYLLCVLANLAIDSHRAATGAPVAQRVKSPSFKPGYCWA